jgi:hypothetical protein
VPIAPPFFVVNIYMTITETILRSPRTATRAFGVGSPNQVVTAVPKTKFMFFVEFVLSAGGRAMITGNTDLNTYNGNRGLSFKVKQIDKPKITIKTTELNQYNKKRLVYTGADYSEASIKLYDTVDDSAMATWIDYFTYYFGDSRIKTKMAYGQSPIDPTFTDESGWGFRPISEDTKFFDKITVYAFYANTYTAFSYINPKITLIDWQTKDYSSSEPEELGISFKYELIEYEAFGKPIRDPSRFGWLPIDTLFVKIPIPDVPQAPLPRIFGQNIINNANQSLDQAVAPYNDVVTVTNLPPETGATTEVWGYNVAGITTGLPPGQTVTIPAISNPMQIPNPYNAGTAGGRDLNFGSFDF